MRAPITLSRILVPAVLLTTGCASLINGTSDMITINSLEPGSRISVDGVPSGLDTAVVKVKRGQNHVIKVEKEGFEPMVAQTGDAFDKTSLLGILIDFGLVSIPADMLMGGAWKTDPLLYTLTPMPRARAVVARSRPATLPDGFLPPAGDGWPTSGTP